jgi:2-hydroxychromene-2-carboxylate isomerase
MLAEKRRDTGPELKLYSMPGADINEDDGDKKSREQRLRDKLEARYSGVQGGPPVMTEEEKFWEMKE